VPVRVIANVEVNQNRRCDAIASSHLSEQHHVLGMICNHRKITPAVKKLRKAANLVLGRKR
jgi:hypothetical protein